MEKKISNLKAQEILDELSKLLTLEVKEISIRVGQEDYNNLYESYLLGNSKVSPVLFNVDKTPRGFYLEDKILISY